MNWFYRALETNGGVLLALLLLGAGTALTVVGSRREMALLVVAGVMVIVVGLYLLRSLSQRVLKWLDRQSL